MLTEAVPVAVRAANQPAAAPITPPRLSSVTARNGSRRSFDAAPWAVCLAADLAAFLATAFLILGMPAHYPAAWGAYTRCGAERPARSESALGGANSSQSLLR